MRQLAQDRGAFGWRGSTASVTGVLVLLGERLLSFVSRPTCPRCLNEGREEAQLARRRARSAPRAASDPVLPSGAELGSPGWSGPVLGTCTGAGHPALRRPRKAVAARSCVAGADRQRSVERGRLANATLRIHQRDAAALERDGNAFVVADDLDAARDKTIEPGHRGGTEPVLVVHVGLSVCTRRSDGPDIARFITRAPYDPRARYRLPAGSDVLEFLRRSDQLDVVPGAHDTKSVRRANPRVTGHRSRGGGVRC